MKRRDSKKEEERLAALLAAYDEQLANGSLPTVDDTPWELVDTEARARLEMDMAVLHQLERVWPRSPASGPDSKEPHHPIKPFTDPYFQPPARIGRFRIKGELGRGGHGIVFLARDPRLEREVALKVPRPEVLLVPELRQRFLREAQAAAGLDHPNVVPVYETGEADGLCYIAAACCDGLTLSAWHKTQETPIGVATAVALVAAIADGVQHAHDHGILHRDLKPSNILLSPKPKALCPKPGADDTLGGLPPSPESGAEAREFGLEFVPRLTDFGLARIGLDSSDASGSTRIGQLLTLTPTGMILGTPSYMAPEQACGCEEKITPATDAYALGVILYELLTSRLPLSGATELEILKKVEGATPDPPSRWRPELSRDLDTICLKCLEKEPRDRYATAAALAEDLRSFLCGDPVQARPVGKPELAWRWAKRRPALVGLSLVSIAAVASLIGVALWFSALLQEAADISAQVQRESANDRALAMTQSRLLRRNEYVKHVHQASRLWKNSQLQPMVDALALCKPKAGEADQRCFAWHYLWRLCHGERVCFRAFELAADAREPSCFTLDAGALAVLGSNNREVQAWDVESGHQQSSFRSSEDLGRFLLLAYIDSKTTLVGASADGKLTLWNVGVPEARRLTLCLPSKAACMAAAPVGTQIATGHADGTIHLWDTADGRHLGMIECQTAPDKLAFSPDGRLLAMSSRDRGCLWDLGARATPVTWELDESISTVAFSPDSLRLAVGYRSGAIEVRHAHTAELESSQMRQQGYIASLAFCPDGKILAAGGADGSVKLWDLFTSQPIIALEKNGLDTTAVTGLEFSVDGKTLAGHTLRKGRHRCCVWSGGIGDKASPKPAG